MQLAGCKLPAEWKGPTDHICSKTSFFFFIEHGWYIFIVCRNTDPTVVTNGEKMLKLDLGMPHGAHATRDGVSTNVNSVPVNVTGIVQNRKWPITD